MRNTALVLIGGLLLGTATPTIAAERKEKLVILEIRHSDGKVDTRRAGGVIEFGELEALMEYEQRHNEKIKIVVADPNPLLFTYKWGEIERTKTADYEAAVKFAESLGTLGGILKGLTGVPSDDGEPKLQRALIGRLADYQKAQEALEKAGITGDFFPRFARDFRILRGHVAAIPGLVAKSANEAQEVKETVAKWEIAGLNSRLDAAFKKINQAQINLLGLPEEEKDELQPELTADQQALQEINKKLGELVDLLKGATADEDPAGKTSGGDKESVDNKKSRATSATDPNNSVSTSRDTPGSAGSLGGDPLKKATSVTSNEPSADGVLTNQETLTNQTVQAVLLVKDQEANTREMMKAAKEFQATAKKIHEEIELGVVEFVANEKAVATVEIEAVEKNASAAKKAKGKTGKFKFDLAPLSPVKLSIGPAVVYSFVELQEFGTTKDGDEIKVVRTDDGEEVNGTTVAAMVGITPRSWDNPIFATSFEIGVSPIEGEIGFFGGVSIRAYKKFRFGIGLAYQEAERAPGFTVGQVLESPDELKTKADFELGAYVSFSLDLK